MARQFLSPNVKTIVADKNVSPCVMFHFTLHVFDGTQITIRHYGLVVSAPAWDGTGCEFDSWQCRIYIPCSLSLRLLKYPRVSGYVWLDTKIVFLKKAIVDK